VRRAELFLFYFIFFIFFPS